MNLAAAFAASAQRHQAKKALFWGDQAYTYEFLFALSQQVAAYLQVQHHIAPGDRVGLWLKNCPEFIPAFFGVLQAGAVVVPINNFLKPAEVEYIISDAGINLLITDDSLAESRETLRSQCPGVAFLRVEDFNRLPPSSAQAAQLARTESDLAVIIYTSGTTGRPKGAMLSHGNLLANVESCRQVLLAIDADRFGVLLPLFHSFMLTVGMLLPLFVGGSIVLVKSLHPPKNVILDLLQHEATVLPAIPQFFRTLANAPLPTKLPLRICISGAAPLPGEILREFTERLSVPLLEGYGLSETSPVVTVNPVKGPWKAGSIGVPISDVEVSIQDDQGNLLAPGQVGEVCVRGPNVMLGYWNQPQQTAEVMRNGWFLTGDIGRKDEDGYFYITDRKKDMLLVNGINVYPREIEEVLYRFPGIKEAAVIGIPDGRKGEQPLAFVALAEGHSPHERQVVHFLRENLADYKVPRHVVFLPALPRNGTGKILKTSLRQLHTAS